MNAIQLFNDGTRRWVVFGRDATRGANLVDTNEYLVTHHGKGLLLDPGGAEIFPSVVAAVSGEIELGEIERIFASHQDPDIVSSLPLWLHLCPQLEVWAPAPWALFIPHFSGGKAVRAIPDEGGALPLGGSSELQLVPAHYCHSSGNFSVYDPTAKILFSGDIGAALLPDGQASLFVEDFARHVGYMEGFHRRWMPSNRAKARWIERVRKLDVKLLCPQHGSIFRGEDVGRFLDWFDALEVGGALA